MAATDGGTHASFLREIADGAIRRGYRGKGIPLPPAAPLPEQPPPPQPAQVSGGSSGRGMAHAEAIQRAAEKRSRQKLLETRQTLASVLNKTGAELLQVGRGERPALN
jgi:hypothetical protein